MNRDASAFEKVLGLIPGYEGYRNREALRETDALLRRSIADQLAHGRRALDQIILERTQAGDLLSLDPLGRMQTRMLALAEKIRLAPRGASGMMADHQIKEEQLQKLLRADEALVDHIQIIQQLFKDEATPETLLPALEARLETLRLDFDQRDSLLSGSVNLNPQD